MRIRHGGAMDGNKLLQRAVIDMQSIEHNDFEASAAPRGARKGLPASHSSPGVQIVACHQRYSCRQPTE